MSQAMLQAAIDAGLDAYAKPPEGASFIEKCLDCFSYLDPFQYCEFSRLTNLFVTAVEYKPGPLGKTAMDYVSQQPHPFIHELLSEHGCLSSESKEYRSQYSDLIQRYGLLGERITTIEQSISKEPPGLNQSVQTRQQRSWTA